MIEFIFLRKRVSLDRVSPPHGLSEGISFYRDLEVRIAAGADRAIEAALDGEHIVGRTCSNRVLTLAQNDYGEITGCPAGEQTTP